MKKLIITCVALSMATLLNAQKIVYHNAAELNVIGKAIPTSKDFTRIDTTAYKFNDEVIEEYCCHFAFMIGLSVAKSTANPVEWQQYSSITLSLNL